MPLDFVFTCSANVDATAPTIASVSPTDNATFISVDTPLAATFSEAMAAGTGNIVLRKNTGGGFADVETFAIPGDIGSGAGTVSISGNVVTIRPTTDMDAGTPHAVRIAAGALEDLAGNAFAGFADDTTWNFTTAEATAFTPPPTPLGSNTGTLTITVDAPATRVAPCPLWVEVSSVSGLAAFQKSGTEYDGKQHEYTYTWWLTGGPLSAFTAPENMYPLWNEPNISLGQKTAFVLPDPGSYTLNVRAVDRLGNYAQGSTTITVLDADDVYSGTSTICYSTSGFTGKPTGAQEVTTLSALNTAIAATTGPTRLLINRGNTLTGRVRPNSGDYLDYVGAFGTGDDPIVSPDAFSSTPCIDWSSAAASAQIIITDINFSGPWNPDTEVEFGGAYPFNWEGCTNVKHVLVNDCTIRGFEKANWGSTNNAAAHKAVMSANNIIEDWSDYGLWFYWNETGKLAVIGTRIAQSPDANQIIDGKKSLTNQHGPIRIPSCRWVVGDVCDLFTNNGWLGDVQPCLRVGTHPTANLNIKLHWSRSVFESGYQVINLEGENAGTQDNPGNFVFEHMVFLSSARTNRTAVSVHKGGFTERNCLHIHPNVPHATASNWPDEFIAGGPNLSQGTNNSEPMQVYNNTGISLLSDANNNSEAAMVMVGATAPFSNVTVANNVQHVPNAGTPIANQAPIDTTTALPGITPRFKGRKSGYVWIEGTGTVPNNGSFVVAYTAINRQNFDGTGSALATSQSYWTANEATDTKHKIAFGAGSSPPVFYAANGEFTVSFPSVGVTITNTSGGDWTGNYYLKLDRTTRAATEIPLNTAYASPATIPNGKPLAGSAALDTGGSGYALLDFDLDTWRPLGNQDAGCWQVTS